uniref:restriction endonuclease subunit S n=2 Tax=Thiolapillus sp. TaxID=2017437 RepID=UPI003AF77D28
MRSKSDKKKPLVPRLRFPEFREAGAWEVKELGEIASISNGLTADQSGDSNGLKVTRIETISEGCIDISKVGYIDRIEGVERFGLRIGDILFSHINSQSHIGKTALVEEDFDLYHGMNLLRLQVDKTENNPRFTYYLLNTEFFRKSVQARSNQAVNQASINQTEVGNSQIAVPSAKEQQKIAHCLSSLDEVIGLQAKKVQALKRHKKGLMQQLFPAEGETTPRLRFPEFREAGAWEVKELSAALAYAQPTPFIVSTEQYGTSGTPVLTAGKTFILGHTSEDFGIYERVPVIIFDDFTTEAKFVDFPFKVKSSAIKILSPRPGYSLKFVLEAIISIQFDASQHKRHWIGEFQHLKIPFPPPKEQQKIAHCLSSLDEVIGLQAKKVQALKQHKKGL